MEENVETKQGTIAELVKQHLEDNRDRLAEQAVAGAIEDLRGSLKYSAHNEVQEQLVAFYKEHVSPGVASYLEDNREEIVAAVVGVLDDQVKAFATKLAEGMAENISRSYERDKIIKALFGLR